MWLKIWIYFLLWIARGLIAVRYHLRIQGIEHLNATTLKKKGGILFLPNHPAEIDPIMLVILLWRKFKIHPLVVEQFYYLKGGHYFQKIIGAYPVPDFNGAVSKWKQQKIEKLRWRVVEGLKKGESFLIYPAGRLKEAAEERIGGASMVHSIVQECPEANIVLVRTTGLWGSRFSRALTGATPNFGAVMWEGCKIAVKNLIFFTPRREVLIEFEPAPAELPLSASRLPFNQYLERWYNQRGIEPLNLVSDAFWKESYPAIVQEKKIQNEEGWSIAPAIEQEICDKIGLLARRDGVTRFHHLSRDIGLDSLDMAQLGTFLIEKYDLEGDVSIAFETVEDVLKAVSRASAVKKTTQIPLPHHRWPTESSRPPIQPPAGKTVVEAFLNNCERMDRSVACADQRMGVVTYRRLKMMVLVLSSYIRSLDGERIGILLPSSVITYALILATLVAKKTPVMMNWTVGARALDHSVKAAHLKTVLSSRLFLDRLSDGDIGRVDDLLVLLEDVKPTIWDKLKGVYNTFFQNADSLIKKLELGGISSEDPAVILFTSGTESLPKAVPLSHHNLLSNHTAALSCIELLSSDALYGVLPPFHSFGFSVTGIFPLLSGLKVYYAPDPTNYHGMAADIAAWDITLFFSAPTFIKGLFRVAAPGQLKSLKYVVGGAEKTPEDLFIFMEKIGGEMLEGYGITECSPIVTLTRPHQPRKGVGTPIPGVKLCIIDPISEEVLASGEEGEVCIQGPNVFSGYLDSSRSPFIQLQGRRWYRSGDWGHLDPDGVLILSGRLKRFVKIGGEMVSLGGLEEEIFRLAQEKRWNIDTKKEIPSLAIAIAGQESEKPLLVLFTTFDAEKDQINEALRATGYGRLIKIAQVRRIQQIPVTGTGKTEYRTLDEMV